MGSNGYPGAIGYYDNRRKKHEYRRRNYKYHPGFRQLCADMGLMFNTHSKSIAVNFEDGIVLITQNDDDTVTCVRDGVELSTKSSLDLTVTSEKYATLLDVEAGIVSVITSLDRVKKT